MAEFWFYVDAPRERGRPCGAVVTDARGIVTGGAPWFRYHWMGRAFRECIRRSRATWKRLRDG